MIGILDYGLGNIASISNSLNAISKKIFFITEKKDFEKLLILLFLSWFIFKGYAIIKKKRFY